MSGETNDDGEIDCDEPIESPKIEAIRAQAAATQRQADATIHLANAVRSAGSDISGSLMLIGFMVLCGGALLGTCSTTNSMKSDHTWEIKAGLESVARSIDRMERK